MALIHGGDVFTLAEKLGKEDREIIDFSVNINPLGLSQKVKEALIDQIDLAVAYPDPLCRKLVTALGNVHKLPEASILCGNGAADLIFRLAHVCKPKKALILAPTFAEYEIALKGVGCIVQYYTLEEETDYQIGEDFFDLLTEELDMIWLCNPNNPTGQLTQKDFMQRVLKKCKDLDIKLIVDECFMDFVEDGALYSVVSEVRSTPHLIVLKAFTKFYGMAGLRLGYALIGDIALKEALGKAAQPWAVSSLAQLAGCIALEDTAYQVATKELIHQERTYLKKAFEDLGFKVYASHADYLFFRSPIKALHEKLAKKGILIRHCENYHGLTEDHYRIGIKTHEMNVFLIRALQELI